MTRKEMFLLIVAVVFVLAAFAFQPQHGKPQKSAAYSHAMAERYKRD